MSKISTKYDTLGPISAALGDAVGTELAIDNNIGTVQFYSNGAVFSSPAGVCCVGCEILTIWAALGGPRGPFGYPIADQCLAADGRGELVAFQGGFITWNPTTGAVETSGVQSGQPGVEVWSELEKWVEQASAAGKPNPPTDGAPFKSPIAAMPVKVESVNPTPTASTALPPGVVNVGKAAPTDPGLGNHVGNQVFADADPQILDSRSMSSAASAIWTILRPGQVQPGSAQHLVPSTAEWRIAAPVTVLRGSISGAPRLGLAYVLSGGGSKGDFEVGALMYLYGLFGPPDIVCGTSVGAINAARLAEGTSDSLAGLIDTWRGLNVDGDMWQFEHWMTELDQIADLAARHLGNLDQAPVLAVAGAILDYLFGTAGGWTASLVNAAEAGWQSLMSSRSTSNIQPIRGRLEIRQPFWSPLGPGIRKASLSAVCNRAGVVELFMRNQDGSLYTRRQSVAGAATAAGWTAWESLGDGLTGDMAVQSYTSSDTVTLAAPRPDGRIWLKTRPAPGGAWSDWTAPAINPHFGLGAQPITSTHVSLVRNEAPVHWWSGQILTTDPAGFTYVFLPDNGWDQIAATEGLHQRISGGIAVGYGSAGIVLLAGRDYQNHPALAPAVSFGRLVGMWSSPDRSLQPAIAPFHYAWNDMGIEATSDPVMASNADGTVEVLVRGTDCGLWHCRQLDAARWGFTAWQKAGGTGTFISNPAAMLDENNCLFVVALGTDDQLWSISQQVPNGQFMDWQPMGGPPNGYFRSDPTLVRNADGRPEIFVAGQDRTVWHRVKPALGQPWGAWEALGGSAWVGPKVRLATVALESGVLRHVTESGVILETGTVVDVGDAIIASASIPAAFPPVKLGSENYVDGGVRSITPVQAAIDAGAKEVFAVCCSVAAPLPGFKIQAPADAEPPAVVAADDPYFVSSYDHERVWDIANRAGEDLLPNQVQQAELDRKWPIPVTLIQPTIQVHNAMHIDPGLTDISIDYGYVRAFEACNSDYRAPTPAASLDAIIRARRDAAYAEQQLFLWVCGFEGRHIRLSPTDPPGDYSNPATARSTIASLYDQIRTLKNAIMLGVQQRGPAGQLPDSAAPADGSQGWHQRWERHRSWLGMPASPWDAASFVPGSGGPPLTIAASTPGE